MQSEERLNERSPYGRLQSYSHLAASAAVLVAIAWAGFRWTTETPGRAWLAILVLLVAFVVIVGHGITGSWRGAFIDGRFRISLGRFQLLAWSFVILSALITAVLKNVTSGWESPLEIDIPAQLWVLMGVSTASAVAGPAVLATKRAQHAESAEALRTAEMLRQQGDVPDERRVPARKPGDTAANPPTGEAPSVVMTNDTLTDARWGDLFKGDEIGNAAAVDLGKLQMFFFTFILLVGYGAALAHLLAAGEVVTALPPVDEGMNVLLGISHTGYVAYKAVPHSREPQAAPGA